MEEISIGEKTFTVSEFISLLNIGLKRSVAKIVGEVCEVKIGPTGHVYFSLKDETDGSVLNCIVWKFKYFVLGIKLQEGMKVIISGNPQIYAPAGKLSFIAETLQPAGEGELKKEYERLKKKLQEEGIFDLEKKRPLPDFLERIGVITSLKGAVIADFSNNLKKFGFKVKLVDSRVEGQSAVSDLILSIKTLKRENVQALVIMRGGGSLESMMAFNNEALIREIAAFPAPVIAGIGHHKDEPLAALAADISVSTPTAAANLISYSWQKAVFALQRQEDIVIREFEEILNLRNKFNESFKNIIRGFENFLFLAQQKLGQIQESVNLNNPERQLKLGYSISFLNGKVLKSAKSAKIGEKIDVKLSDGIIETKVSKL